MNSDAEMEDTGTGWRWRLMERLSSLPSVWVINYPRQCFFFIIILLIMQIGKRDILNTETQEGNIWYHGETLVWFWAMWLNIGFKVDLEGLIDGLVESKYTNSTKCGLAQVCATWLIFFFLIGEGVKVGVLIKGSMFSAAGMAGSDITATGALRGK